MRAAVSVESRNSAHNCEPGQSSSTGHSFSGGKPPLIWMPRPLIRSSIRRAFSNSSRYLSACDTRQPQRPRNSANSSATRPLIRACSSFVTSLIVASEAWPYSAGRLLGRTSPELDPPQNGETEGSLEPSDASWASVTYGLRLTGPGLAPYRIPASTPTNTRIATGVAEASRNPHASAKPVHTGSVSFTLRLASSCSDRLAS